MALATLRAGEGAGLVRTVLSIDGPVKWRPPRSVQGLFSFEFLSSKTFCSRCKLLVYCSPICQLEHYNKTHKNHCKYLAGIKVFILNTNTCFVNANTNTTSRSWFLIFNTITTPASRSRRVPSTPRRTVPGYIFIGPESDHCLPLSLTDWLTDSLTHSCLVNLIDVTLACEDANSKLVDVVTVADEDRVGNNLL